MLSLVFASLGNAGSDLQERARGEVASGPALGDSASLVVPTVDRPEFCRHFLGEEFLGGALGPQVDDHHDQGGVRAGVFVGFFAEKSISFILFIPLRHIM